MGSVLASRASHARSGHVSLAGARGRAQGDSELMAQHQDLGVLWGLLGAGDPVTLGIRAVAVV
jgi:hypothetical protein